jgi:periplasmic copper chaperone A
MNRAMFFLIVGLFLATACSTPVAPGAKIRVENAWAIPSAASAPSHSGMSGGETSSAVYFTIVNETNTPDVLLGATSAVAMSTELNETLKVGDVAKMVPAPRVEVPAQGRVEFKPGGLHVMLMGLMQDLVVGKKITVTFKFEKSGAITLDVPIQLEK